MTFPPITLRLDDFLEDGASYRAARVALNPGHRMPAHAHDFAEVFWIERGEGSHLVNGERRGLRRGDLVLMRPTDVHTFRAAGAGDFVQVNVAFDAGTLDFLRERYFDQGDWPWAGDALPAAYRLEDHARLAEFSGILFSGPPTRLVLERFLLDVLHELVAPAIRPGLPMWLEQALRRLSDDPTALEAGVPALAVLAGRSREHVNRVLRKALGQTATEVVQGIRLTRAATDLRMTDTPISRIAVDCGIANLSHFHRLFKGRFGVTPRRFRLEHQALVRGVPER